MAESNVEIRDPMPRVLIVDDDDAIRESLRDVLEYLGYTVDSAENGQAALARMQTARPCMVLLDLMMPVMDGWQVVEAMAADPRLMAIPVCVLSAQARRAPPPSACVLHKPVTVEELLAVITRFCGGAEARR